MIKLYNPHDATLFYPDSTSHSFLKLLLNYLDKSFGVEDVAFVNVYGKARDISACHEGDGNGEAVAAGLNEKY